MVFFHDRWTIKEEAPWTGLPGFQSWLREGPPQAERTERVAKQFVLQYVKSTGVRFEHDITFFKAATLFDPAMRRIFRENPYLIDVYLAQFKMEYPDLVTQIVFVTAHLYFQSDDIDSIAPPDPVELKLKVAKLSSSARISLSLSLPLSLSRASSLLMLCSNRLGSRPSRRCATIQRKHLFLSVHCSLCSPSQRNQRTRRRSQARH